jgi:hypothetical protein
LKQTIWQPWRLSKCFRKKRESELFSEMRRREILVILRLLGGNWRNWISSETGLPDFSWYNIPKQFKINQITRKYTKWPQNTLNGHKIYQIVVNRPKFHKIYQHLPLQDPPKFTPIAIFGLKICHLATLIRNCLQQQQQWQLRTVHKHLKSIPTWDQCYDFVKKIRQTNRQKLVNCDICKILKN